MSNNDCSFRSGMERKNLILAFVAGVCGDAILSWLTMSEVSFSIFPFIALALAVQSLYQSYLQHPVSEDFPLVGVACFFVGIFGHSAFMKAQYPEEGSNFLAIILTLLLMMWIGKKMGYWGRKD
ncbi:Inner membrane protein YijD [Vibrio aerogenes CECT 7868]|uniref:Inner membrane protein YijD n=1 Tax=Vibrio aerogenes CECT 7868 TaxID=1216006 RepID=A0A1M6EZU5_9VIBR|nr:YijD family membrane protein [Vibrio aerogenes]SHI90962.1 Inner membrane protein YijD [Vibrio aerogenes CECT 7868]